MIDVFAVNNNQYGFWGENVSEDSHDIGPILKKASSDTFLYFAPTNLFCGPIELQDNNHKKISLLRPDVSLPDSYPAFFSLIAARKNNPHPTTVFPRSLHSSRDLLAHFELEDYFDIKQAGQYELTVWPKIYKRASTNDDICQRIDLPPVTVTIKWDGTPSK